MAKIKNNNGIGSAYKSVILAYFILFLHILLIASIGVLVLFFRGIVSYMFWILIFGMFIITVSAYILYFKMKRQGKNLREMFILPNNFGRDIEVSFLGGIVSLKINNSDKQLPYKDSAFYKQIENFGSVHYMDMAKLVCLFENRLITLEEYNKAKDRLLNL